MDAKTYQAEAARTLIDDSTVVLLTAREHRIAWNALGAAGEAGEIWALCPDNPAAGQLARRAMELCEHVKKAIFHGCGLDVTYVAGLLAMICDRAGAVAATSPFDAPVRTEIGDLLWYVAALCSILEIALADTMDQYSERWLAPVMAANIAKLRIRFPHGWDKDDAAARVDVVEA